MGAQWLSGRVLVSRPNGRRFEPHRRHCVVSLSKNINPSLVLVQPRKTRPFITERLLIGRKESNQTNKQISIPSMQKELIDTQFLSYDFRSKAKNLKKKSILFLPLPLQCLQYRLANVFYKLFVWKK